MNKRGQKSIYFLKKSKRGQYYLVAAVIFVVLFSILLSIVNQSKKETNTRIYELQKEMKIESSKVMEYYANTGNDKIEDFTKNYSKYAGYGINIYSITGDLITREVYNYTNGVKGATPPYDFDEAQNTLNVTIEEKLYSFKFESGKNFYFVLTQKNGNEKYILIG
jgi:hypothetical protein